jgi:hypothetical protein
MGQAADAQQRSSFFGNYAVYADALQQQTRGDFHGHSGHATNAAFCRFL